MKLVSKVSSYAVVSEEHVISLPVTSEQTSVISRVCVHVLAHAYMCMCESVCVQEPKETGDAPAAEVTGYCELYGVGAANQTCALYKSILCS